MSKERRMIDLGRDMGYSFTWVQRVCVMQLLLCLLAGLHQQSMCITPFRSEAKHSTAPTHVTV
jgi:hypothetical protein